MLAFARRKPSAPRVLIVRQTDLYEMPVRRQAEALSTAGLEVEVICMHHPDRPRRAVVNGVRVTSLRIGMTKSSKAGYALGYGAFFLAATLAVTGRCLRRRYRVVQVNTMPDFLVFCAAGAKLSGAKVVAYMNEPTPELAETIYGSPRISRLMIRLEQAALRFADHAITVTTQLRARYAERGADPARISVVLNGTDRATLLAGWAPPEPPPPHEHFSIICHGTIEDRYGQDTIVEAAALAREHIPKLEIVFTGRGSYVPEVLALAKRLGVDDITRFEGWVDNRRMNDLLHAASVGVVAQKSSPYSNLVTTNKMSDYWIHGLPVIASRLDAVAALCDDDTLEYYEAGNARSLADALVRLYEDPARRQELVRNGDAAAERYGWTAQKQAYLSVYKSLFAAGARPGAAVRAAPGQSASTALTAEECGPATPQRGDRRV
jgi:glycosyltransferase involved in cell wall biosynthesis